MNAAWLLKHFDRISEGPEAVARLRRFILDLAVRGKLVDQDPEDEPAAELVRKIKEQKTVLGIRPEELPVQPGDAAFVLPHGWAWSQIGEICSKTGSGSTPRGGREVYKTSGILFLRSQNVYDDGLKLEDVAYIDAATHQRMAGTAVKSRDLLLNITGGSIGRCCRVPDEFGEANVSQHVAILRAAISEMADFLHVVIRSPYFQHFIFDEQTGAGRGGLPKKRMDRIAVALPPFAEQQRIVAKVDEMMALCDQLEAAKNEREARRDRLVVASLARLNTPAPDPATFADHARFALDSLPALTTRPDQIKQLRQTILNLAVRGKLVPQDTKDEPASELLRRVTAEKSRQEKLGTVARNKPLSRDPRKHADALPASWMLSAMGDVCNFITSGSRGWAAFYATTGPGFIRAQNIRFGQLRLEDLAHVNLPSKQEGARTQVSSGDLLIVITGAGVTNPAMLERDIGEAYVSQHVALLRPTERSFSKWLLLCLMADEGSRAELVERAYGAGKPGLNLDNIWTLSVPIPPLAEQHRIVAKVGELMALCDQLEASLAASTDTRRRLLEATLGAALEPTMEEAA